MFEKSLACAFHSWLTFLIDNLITDWLITIRFVWFVMIWNGRRPIVSLTIFAIKLSNPFRSMSNKIRLKKRWKFEAKSKAWEKSSSKRRSNYGDLLSTIESSNRTLFRSMIEDRRHSTSSWRLEIVSHSAQSGISYDEDVKIWRVEIGDIKNETINFARLFLTNRKFHSIDDELVFKLK